MSHLSLGGRDDNRRVCEESVPRHEPGREEGGGSDDHPGPSGYGQPQHVQRRHSAGQGDGGLDDAERHATHLIRDAEAA